MGKKRIVKVIKWFIGIVLGFVVLITAGLYIFKDDIIQLVIDEVNDHLKAKVSVSNVDLTFWGTFPNLSVDFNNVFIQDAFEGSTPADTLLYSERIRLRFNPMDLWRENYTIQEVDVFPGTLQLKVDRLGSVNYDILKPSEDSTQSDALDFDLKAVNIEQLRFSYANAATDQRYATDIADLQLEGRLSEEIFTLNAQSNLHVKEARSGKVNLISNKPAQFDVRISVDQHQGLFHMPKAQVLVAGLPFDIEGKVTADSILFDIRAHKLALTEVARSFSMDQLNQVTEFSGSGEVDFTLNIAGVKSSVEPIGVDCAFAIRNGKLIEPVKKQRISSLSLTGNYSNRGGAANEFLALNNIRFTTATGPFSGQLRLTEFNAPRLTGVAKGSVNLQVIHALFKIPSIQNVSGNLGLDATFNIKALPQPDEHFVYDIQRCEGSAQFNAVSLQLVDDKRLFRDINGNVALHNDRAALNQVQLKLGQSDLEINGAFEHIIGYFKQEEDLVATIQLVSRAIEIADLGTTAKEEQLNEPRTYMIPDRINGSVSLSVGSLSYEGHRFELLSGNLSIANRTLSFPQLSFRNAGATVQGDLVIEERTPELFHVTTHLSSSNILLRKLMEDWNNFTQDVIRSEHISGQAAAQLYLEAPFDLRSGVLFKAVKSDLQLKIQDGRLTDVETFKSIVKSLRTPAAKLAIGSNNITALERKLSDLKFETLENTLMIRNGVIQIPEMKINSSALNIEASGTHTFDNKIDYRFAFRFRDLKQAKTSEFGNIVDDGTGVVVYLRMHGTMDNPIIEWDKAAKKEDRQEYNAQEKQNLKGMLKSDFGLYANDSTVKKFQPIQKPKETLEIHYGPDTTSVDEFVKEKQKKEGKFSKFLQKMEAESKQSNSVEVEFE